MSANIKWKPVIHDGKDLQVSAPSAFIQSMESAFGCGPWELDAHDNQKLLGMAAVHGGSPDDNPYLNIIEAMGSQRIKVWVEY